MPVFLRRLALGIGRGARDSFVEVPEEWFMAAFERLSGLMNEASEEAARLARILEPRDDLGAVLERAAEAWVSENERRRMSGLPELPLDLAEGFVGLVLEAAIAREQGTEPDRVRAAFLNNGKARTVNSRNHWALLERLKQRSEALRAALKPPTPHQPAREAATAAP
jgi:hypothetical protein